MRVATLGKGTVKTAVLLYESHTNLFFFGLVKSHRKHKESMKSWCYTILSLNFTFICQPMKQHYHSTGHCTTSKYIKKPNNWWSNDSVKPQKSEGCKFPRKYWNCPYKILTPNTTDRGSVKVPQHICFTPSQWPYIFSLYSTPGL